MQSNIEAFRWRPQSSFTAGGLTDLASGLYCFLIAGLFWLATHQQRAFSPFLDALMIIPTLLAIHGARKALEARLVWPRLGYVVPRTPPASYFVVGTLFYLGVIACTAFLPGSAKACLTAFSAVPWAVAFYTSRSPLSLIGGALTIAGGCVLVALHCSFMALLIGLFLIIGTLQLVFGAYHLAWLLQIPPTFETEAE